MIDQEVEKYTGLKSLNVVEAMERISRNSKGILYIVDEQDRLQGSLTDGDIRRWILKTGNLNGTAGDMQFSDTKYLLRGEEKKAVSFMRQYGIRSVPVLDQDRKVVGILFDDLLSEGNPIKENSALSDTPVIIMAGGKGTRLYPYTKILPKPLIPIGDVPVLERIMDRFHAFGAEEFYLTVNYRKEMIKAYFAELDMPYKIHFIEEEEPLGTAGGIRLIRQRFDRPVVVTNCDILIEADYADVLAHHQEVENEITVVSSLKDLSVPYGVLHSQDGGRISSIEEKPRFTYFINTGMYVVNPEHFSRIPGDRMYHMTDLVENVMAGGGQIGMYPIAEDSFLDMGEFEALKRMEERINERR